MMALPIVIFVLAVSDPPAPTEYTLRDGNVLVGIPMSETESTLVVDTRVGQITLQKSSIATSTLLSSVGCSVALTDGTRLQGTTTRTDGDTIDLQTQSLGRVQIKRVDIASIRCEAPTQRQRFSDGRITRVGVSGGTGLAASPEVKIPLSFSMSFLASVLRQRRGKLHWGGTLGMTGYNHLRLATSTAAVTCPCDRELGMVLDLAMDLRLSDRSYVSTMMGLLVAARERADADDINQLSLGVGLDYRMAIGMEIFQGKRSTLYGEIDTNLQGIFAWSGVIQARMGLTLGLQFE